MLSHICIILISSVCYLLSILLFYTGIHDHILPVCKGFNRSEWVTEVIIGLIFILIGMSAFLAIILIGIGYW